jgi:hypothetical protein
MPFIVINNVKYSYHSNYLKLSLQYLFRFGAKNLVEIDHLFWLLLIGDLDLTCPYVHSVQAFSLRQVQRDLLQNSRIKGEALPGVNFINVKRTPFLTNIILAPFLCTCN